MSAIQLAFSLRTSSGCKTVHLIGSWDGYVGQLPLSKDKSKSGSWKGTFRFQGTTLKQGQRYWYYYIVDGYHVSHDPAREYTTEPTTGRKLNILDLPAAKSSSGKSLPAPAPSSRARNRPASIEVAKGRALSPSKIQSPKPVNPSQTKHFFSAEYEPDEVGQLSSRFSRATINPSSPEFSSEEEGSGSEWSGSVPSLSSRSSSKNSSSSSSPSLSSSRGSSTSPSSVSSNGSHCSCERYGITRSGNRVKLDCGGSRCRYSAGESDLSCESGSDEEYRRQVGATRRQGVVVRR